MRAASLFRASLNASLSAALALLAACGAAHAGSLQLLVTDKDGKPAADVVVLVDTGAKAVPLPPAAPVVILQENLRFAPFLTVVAQGSTVRFLNKDAYDHHVRSTPSGPLGATAPVKTFELRLDGAEGAAAAPNDEYKSPAAAPRKKSGASSADVKMDVAGPIGLGCHIHGSMRGQLYVSRTPWFAKTDANGAAVIDGVPDGNVEVLLWHPDQLQDQAPVRVQIGAAPAKLTAPLNFTPRRRRS